MQESSICFAPPVRAGRASSRFNCKSQISNRKSAFTLLELLVAIGIITLLIGILIPTIGRVRTAARQADTRAQIASIAAACENYFGDFRAYPGPFSNDQLNSNAAYPGGTFASFTIVGDGSTLATSATGSANTSFPGGGPGITSSENLVLGLLGGLSVDNSVPATPKLVYNIPLVGKGANSLNINNPKKYAAYMDPTNLSLRKDDHAGMLRTGKWGDEGLPITDYISGGCADSIIPEFVDRYADPMPIIYLRARTGAAGSATLFDEDNNPVVSSSGVNKNSQYDQIQITPYTASFDSTGGVDTAVPPAANTRCLGVSKIIPAYVENGVNIGKPVVAYHGLRVADPTYLSAPATSKAVTGSYYPLPAFPYLRNPTLSGASPNTAPNVARNKDGFILISAGTDRIYGTADDITNFGDVLP